MILLVGGSLRSGSTHEAVLRTAAEVANVETQRYEGLADLPHFNPDDDVEPLDPAVIELRRALGAADAVLFCTPEYAGALPGSFKNLLDWSVGGGETYGKRVAWINSAGPAAPTAAAGAHDSLRAVLGYTGSVIVEAACVRIPIERGMVADGVVTDLEARKAIAGAVAALAAAA